MLTIGSYMSKAPGKVADYDGSGPWFKFYDWGEQGRNPDCGLQLLIATMCRS